MTDKKITEKDLQDATKVIISPWEDGFTCGMIFGKNTTVDFEEDVCAIIARGMIKQAVVNPQETYLLGLEGFKEDKEKLNKNIPTFGTSDIDDQEDNVVNFYDFFKPNNPKDIN